MKKDMYGVLGLQKGASAEEIKSAFRKKAKECHPDTHPGDKAAEAKFKEINAAYEVLSDPQKKSNYDRFGDAEGPQFGGGGFGGGNPFGAGGVHFDFGDLGDIGDFIFNSFGGDMFGGGGRRASRMRGGDIHASMVLTFRESALGVTKMVNYSRMEKCGTCNGTGARGGDVETCKYCNGQGRVRQRGMLGFATVVPCSACNGRGKTIKNKCDPCRGAGAVKKSVSYEVNIPAGIADGQAVNIEGEGDAAINGGPDGMRGSLVIAIRVQPHPILVRDGYDLHMELPISFTQSILGCKVKIPTIEGTTEITIAPYTQNGTRHILRGKGIKRLRQMGSGDLVVIILVEMPNKLDRKTLDAIAALNNVIDPREYSKRRSYDEKMGKL